VNIEGPAYVLIAGAVLFVFDWFVHTPSLTIPGVEDADDDAAAVMVPIGPPP